MNLVSIIIVTRNHSKYLLKCLNSVLNQTYKNFEVVIVDHDSSDNTAEIIIAKQRHGPIGSINLSFTDRYTKFGNLIKNDNIPEGF